ncbi:MAG: hypothetical protein ACKO42_04175 [Gammaproteobacteria bacterium]
MTTRSPRTTSLSLIVIFCCAGFAYFARKNGFSDAAVAIGATIISAVLLGYVWRRQSKDDIE